MYPTNPNVNENVVPGVPLGVASQYHQHEHYDRHHHQQITAEGPWSSGLCGCCSDVQNCCVTCWCPCITFGQITEIVDKGTTSCGVSGALYALLFYLTGCACCYSCFYRAKLRKQYNIAESPCGDCLVHCCCEECALCQEYRELKARGFDMSFGVGWHENMAKQSRVGAMPAPSAPMMEVGMKR